MFLSHVVYYYDMFASKISKKKCFFDFLCKFFNFKLKGGMGKYQIIDPKF